MTKRGLALFAAMAFIWGIPYLLIRIAVRELTLAFSSLEELCQPPSSC